jgi:hypothetical protein
MTLCPTLATQRKTAHNTASIQARGYGGIALSFVNYKDELPYFCDTISPLLTQMELHT